MVQKGRTKILDNAANLRDEKTTDKMDRWRTAAEVLAESP